VIRTNSWTAAGEPAAPKRRGAGTAAGKGRPAAPERAASAGAASAEAVRALIEPTVSGLGYELVEVQRAAHGLLRVAVDTTTPARAIGLDDCERISRQLTHVLAVEQIEYEQLEVGSPGLDRRLVGARDFVRFAGSLVRLQLRQPLQGRRRFQGRLLGLVGPAGAERVLLQPAQAAGGPVDPGRRGGRGRRAAPVGPVEPPLELALADIEKARLVPQFNFKGGSQAPRMVEGQR
jgi:ribosome maturation factor RimP